MNRRGFTLIELLFVLIIVLILNAVAVPQHLNFLEKTRSIEAIIYIGSLRRAMDRYWYNQRAFSLYYRPATLDKLDIGNPNGDIDRFFNYTIKDNSTEDIKNYTIRAERIGKPETHWIQWMQIDNDTGSLYKSNALGGQKKLTSD
ncbi:MAG: prepilin-type N-terminal cleavage/methylation domain-containing protein [Candidatus Omnitrophica bacterium]|nr:prepilin-type N-terminal cleavage/methylation domain-containing protein [Candidatus Omnitrophota bacterium]